MGCDIHLAVERRNADGQWERVLPPEEARDPWYVEQAAKNPESKYYAKAAEVTWYADRNYEAFAILAGVRNRFDITPISEPRGLPSDMSDAVRSLTSYDSEDGEVGLGDHSQSWLTVQEILDYDADQPVTISGFVTPSEFAKWKSNGRPDGYCQSVGGGGVEIVSNDRMARLIETGEVNTGGGVAVRTSYYTKVEWHRLYRESAGSFFTRVLPALVALGPPADTRIVFGFDS